MPIQLHAAFEQAAQTATVAWAAHDTEANKLLPPSTTHQVKDVIYTDHNAKVDLVNAAKTSHEAKTGARRSVKANEVACAAHRAAATSAKSAQDAFAKAASIAIELANIDETRANKAGEKLAKTAATFHANEETVLTERKASLAAQLEAAVKAAKSYAVLLSRASGVHDCEWGKDINIAPKGNVIPKIPTRDNAARFFNKPVLN